MNDQDFYLKTIKVIEQRGWDHGSGWAWEVPGKLCLEGAMMMVLGTTKTSVLYAHPAYKKLQQRLNYPNLLWHWNDVQGVYGPNMGKRRVIAALQRAANAEMDTAHHRLVQSFLARQKEKELAVLRAKEHVLAA